MKSEELNQKIRAICDDETLPYEAFGGKCIPYIGWFWRTVDFDSKDYDFGVLPIIQSCPGDNNDKPRLGFMENNKWDYDYCHCPPQAWVVIKRLLEIAVDNPTKENLRAVDDMIQSLLHNNKEPNNG